MIAPEVAEELDAIGEVVIIVAKRLDTMDEKADRILELLEGRAVCAECGEHGGHVPFGPRGRNGR